MKVIKPSNNPITGSYTNTHKAYDFAGLNLPDEVRAGMDGQVIEIMNNYSTNWTSMPPLTTKDYGNYIKVKHSDGSIELHCHIRKDSMLGIGTQVKAGQVIARIGNTGNSTGPHLHSEYRSAANVNTPVEFIDQASTDPLQACLAIHAEDVEKLLAYEKQIKDLKATEERLKKEKEVVRIDLEGKLKVEQDKVAKASVECELKLIETRKKVKEEMLEKFKNYLSTL